LILLACRFLVFWSFFFKSQNALWQRWGWGLAIGVALVWLRSAPKIFEGYAVQNREDTQPVATGLYRLGNSRKAGAGPIFGQWDFGITKLTPITKFMVIPDFFFIKENRNRPGYLVRHGTTFRSALSWDIDTTTVELLVPS